MPLFGELFAKGVMSRFYFDGSRWHRQIVIFFHENDTDESGESEPKP